MCSQDRHQWQGHPSHQHYHHHQTGTSLAPHHRWKQSPRDHTLTNQAHCTCQIEPWIVRAHHPPEGEPLHSVVEEFADDQNAWLRDFLPALQKMVENKGNDLVEAPTGWWNAECVYQKRNHLVCE